MQRSYLNFQNIYSNLSKPTKYTEFDFYDCPLADVNSLSISNRRSLCCISHQSASRNSLNNSHDATFAFAAQVCKPPDLLTCPPCRMVNLCKVSNLRLAAVGAGRSERLLPALGVERRERPEVAVRAI